MPGQMNFGPGQNPGQPGLLFDNERSNQDIVTVIAAEIIQPGVVCEFVVSGTQLLLQMLRDTGTAGTFLPKYAGISVLDTCAVEQGYLPYAVPAASAGSSLAGYPKGFAVPVLRRGRIWTAWDGNTGIALPLVGAINVWHSSDESTFAGVLTTKVPQTTLHSEIDALGAQFNVFDPRGLSGAYTNVFGDVRDIVAMEVNLPGHV